MIETPLRGIWRRKWIVLLIFLLFTGGTAIVSTLLPKVYSASTTLLVARPGVQQDFESVQGSQSIARSYASLAESPNIAERVAERLAAGYSTSHLSTVTSSAAVPETPLVKLTAEAGTATRAQAIANAWGEVFVEYATANLASRTGNEVSVADPASTPRSAARPRPALYITIGALLGLVLGLGVASALGSPQPRLREPAAG